MPVDLAQARRDVAAQLAGLGLEVTVDPAALNLPCVLVDVPDRVDAVTVDYRRWRMPLPVRLLAPPSPGAWDWLLTVGPTVLEALGGAQLEGSLYLAGAAELPCLTVTVSVSVTDVADPLEADVLEADPPPQEATP